MRRLATALVALAFAGAIAQSPWAHIHLHGYDPDHQHQHVGLESLHGHGIHKPDVETRWRSHSADEDAWAVGIRAAVRGSAPVPPLYCDSVLLAADPSVMDHTQVADFQERAHGPPALLSVGPRAPPA